MFTPWENTQFMPKWTHRFEFETVLLASFYPDDSE